MLPMAKALAAIPSVNALLRIEPPELQPRSGTARL